MPPILATILIWGFIGFLFWRELRTKPNVTAALWLPFIWFFLICTRTIGQWLPVFGISVGGNTYEEGNAMDATIFLALIIAGVLVLQRRHFSMAAFVQNNRLLVVFGVYSLLSVLWADDYMFVSFKRWIKVLGHPVMVLVLLSEPDPEEAIIQLMKRCSYVLFPISILFIKYYPQWGRTFDPFLGLPSNTGIALDKNMMGSVCMVTGMFLMWYLSRVWQRPSGRARSSELVWVTVVLLMNLWVLYMAHSSTSLISLLVGAGLIFFLGLKSVNREKLTVYLVTTVVVIVAAQWTFDVYGQFLTLLGKDPTLTDRTKVWSEVLKIEINPIIGTGFESFWLGERREAMWQLYWWHPIQAHNGYIETYLNLGYIGLGFMVLLIVNAYRKALRMLLAGIDFGRYRLGFLVAFMLYNWTEAAFKAMHPVFFVFFLAAIDYGTLIPAARVENAGPMVDT